MKTKNSSKIGKLQKQRKKEHQCNKQGVIKK